MDSIVQNGWDQLACQYTDLVALTLLYYDYMLTIDSERRLFWSRRSLKQWGPILFFVNRYCGIVGHTPVFIHLFARPGSKLYALCGPVYSYHQILALAMQAIVVVAFITRTYALYDRSRVVLVGLTSLALAGVVVGGFMISGEKLPMNPVLPEGSLGCPEGLSWSQSWRLAVAWGFAMLFDLIMIVMTLVKTIQVSQRSRGGHTIIRILVRDGTIYFGVMSLSTLSNILSFMYGSELTRGATTTMTNVLSSVLVSRLMINLREPREHSSQGSQLPISIQLQPTDTLTNIEVFGEAADYETFETSGRLVSSHRLPQTSDLKTEPSMPSCGSV